MAQIFEINEQKKTIVVVRNIGFMKSIKDIFDGGSESEGYQELIKETVNIANENIPEGFFAQKIFIKPIDDKNVCIQLDALKN